MNYCISEFENGEYRITFDKYDDFERVTKLMANDEALESHKTEKECSSCKCKEKETSKAEKDTKLKSVDIADIAALCNTPKYNSPDYMLLSLILTIFATANNNDGYLKGKCDAYESIFMPNKQEENMQKARAAFAELKKSVENLTNEGIK